MEARRAAYGADRRLIEIDRKARVARRRAGKGTTAVDSVNLAESDIMSCVIIRHSASAAAGRLSTSHLPSSRYGGYRAMHCGSMTLRGAESALRRTSGLVAWRRGG